MQEYSRLYDELLDVVLTCCWMHCCTCLLISGFGTVSLNENVICVTDALKASAGKLATIGGGDRRHSKLTVLFSKNQMLVSYIVQRPTHTQLIYLVGGKTTCLCVYASPKMWVFTFSIFKMFINHELVTWCWSSLLYFISHKVPYICSDILSVNEFIQYNKEWMSSC